MISKVKLKCGNNIWDISVKLNRTQCFFINAMWGATIGGNPVSKHRRGSSWRNELKSSQGTIYWLGWMQRVMDYLVGELLGHKLHLHIIKKCLGHKLHSLSFKSGHYRLHNQSLYRFAQRESQLLVLLKLNHGGLTYLGPFKPWFG